MQYIGILSDTHGYINPKIMDFFSPCSQVWHAGDIGTIATADQIARQKPLTAVYGNIDGIDVRAVYKSYVVFKCEEVKAFMMHIGGHPGRYSPEALKLIESEKPGLFVCGHSHILKVVYDEKHKLLHINPGAAGNSGFHQVITCVRLKIEGQRMFDLEVLELPRQGLSGYEKQI